MASRPSSPLDQLLSSGDLQRGRRQPSGKALKALPAPEASRRAPSARARKSALDVVAVPEFSRLDWLLHGFSTRTGGETTVYRPAHPSGELNLGFSASDDP